VKFDRCAGRVRILRNGRLENSGLRSDRLKNDLPGSDRPGNDPRVRKLPRLVQDQLAAGAVVAVGVDGVAADASRRWLKLLPPPQ
jgi:hypothetical protein